MVEDASSVARHKQHSSTQQLHAQQQQQTLVRRRGRGDSLWRNSSSFDYDVTSGHNQHRYRGRAAANENRRSVPSFPLFGLGRSNSKKNLGGGSSADWNGYISEKDFSVSLANLARASQDQELMPPPPLPPPLNGRGGFNTVSAATGRRMSVTSRPSFQDGGGVDDDDAFDSGSSGGGRRMNQLPRAALPHTGSLWSLK